MRNFFIRLSLVIVIFSLSFIYKSYADEYRLVRSIVDIHTNLSDGIYSPERVMELARNSGVECVFINDSLLMRFEYGVWPLRNLLKRKFESNSIIRMGAKNYFNRLKIAGEELNFPLLITGAEASPYYYWEGNPFNRKFSLNDYHKKFLIMGLNYRDYNDMPIIGNRGFKLSLINIRRLILPLALISLGIFLLRRKVLGISLVLTGMIFMLNILPFFISRYNQYNTGEGVKPYQDLIDYVNEKGGIIFWAHTEMGSLTYTQGVQIYTPEHSQDLIETHGYTGFAVSFTDRLENTEPGGIWDRLLLDYINAKRKSPVWIIGAMHYEGERRRIDSVETLLFSQGLTQNDIFSAIREGRAYVRFNLGSNSVVLNEFKAEKSAKGLVIISLKGSSPDSKGPIEIELIKNGQVMLTQEEIRKEWQILIEDNAPINNKQYYRVKIKSPDSLIFTNPLFLDIK